METVKRKVLIVEDEIEVARMIAQFLQREGFETSLAHTLKEGLKKAKDDYPIILLDIMLGKESSFPILKKAKAINPGNIVLMVTATDTEENLKKSRQLGADGFIPKPIMSNFLKKFITDKISEIEEKRKFENG